MASDKSKPEAPDWQERIAINRQKGSWHQTVIIVVCALILGAAILTNGIPNMNGDGGNILLGVVVLGMIYLIFIRQRKQDVDAGTLVAMLVREWQSGRLGHHTWDQMDFSLPNVQIEQLTPDIHLISCNNPYGGTKTLSIHGNDAKALRILQIYDGDAASTRMRLEKSKIVMTGLEHGQEIRKIEAMADKIGA